MRWIHSASPAPQEELTLEYNSARSIGKLRFGDTRVFFPKFSGVSYLPYAQIAHAWLRVEEVNAKLCCGRANFDQHFLMVKDTDGSVRRAELKDRKQADEALAFIAAHNPSAEIGFYKPA